jgi:hypothetical protein
VPSGQAAKSLRHPGTTQEENISNHCKKYQYKFLPDPRKIKTFSRHCPNIKQ